MDEPLPQRFGPFVLLRLLGVGGMGKAYLARHGEWQGRLVVKRMHAHLKEDDVLLKRFVHEAQVATYVRHPNVAALIAMGTVEDEPFFATEYVLGPQLSTIVDRIETSITGPVPLPVALHLGIGIASGVEAIHEARHLETGEPLHLVHRDIGARNVLVGADGRPRLIDLGLGKSSLADWQTATNLFAGSPDYMPPEQALGKRVDRRADVYATAVTIWELIAGRKRIREAALPSRIARAIEAQPEPLLTSRPDATRRLEATLQQAMAPDPDQRTPTVTMLRLALARELAEIAPEFDARIVPQWVESACATVIAKERRLLEEAEAADPWTGNEAGGRTQILVAHQLVLEPRRAATTAPARATTEVEPTEAQPRAIAGTAVKRWRLLLGDLLGSGERQRRWQLQLFFAGTILATILTAAIAFKVATREGSDVEPLAEIIEPNGASIPAAQLAEPGPEVEPDPASEPVLDPPDAGAAPDEERADDKVSPALAAKKRELVGRLRDLRRTKFEVSFQRKLTELGSRLSRAKSAQSVAEIEGQIRRLERGR